MSHTPGPWYANKDCIEIDGPRGPRDVTLAVVMQPTNAEADARLMAAAIDLLAALKLLRDPDGDGQWPCYCDDPHFDGGMCENCVASKAIAKAEGTAGPS